MPDARQSANPTPSPPHRPPSVLRPTGFPPLPKGNRRHAIIERLDLFRKLPDSWAGQRSKAPTDDTIDRAIDLVRDGVIPVDGMSPALDLDGSVVIESEDGFTSTVRVAESNVTTWSGRPR